MIAKRVHEIAKEAGVASKVVVKMLQSIGCHVKSASSRVSLQPFEYEAVVAASKEMTNGKHQ